MRLQFFLFFLIAAPISPQLYMIVEYNTNGTVKRNAFNVTMQTVNLNIKILGCDEGYYEGWNGTNLVCTQCICELFDTAHLEPFVIIPSS